MDGDSAPAGVRGRVEALEGAAAEPPARGEISLREGTVNMRLHPMMGRSESSTGPVSGE